MRKHLQVILGSVSVYAVSSVYVFVVLALLLIATGDIMFILGIFAFGIVTITGLTALLVPKGRITQWLTRR